MKEMKLANPQLTSKEAIAFYDSGEWKSWSDEQIIDFQLYQECVCLPFDRFKAALSAVLNRPVFTHEFVDPERLQQEYETARSRA